MLWYTHTVYVIYIYVNVYKENWNKLNGQELMTVYTLQNKQNWYYKYILLTVCIYHIHVFKYIIKLK